MKRIYLIALLSVFAFPIQAQSSSPLTKYEFLNRYNLSLLWSAGTAIGVDDPEPEFDYTRPEPIGYIGNDFQRFYIHFTSIKKGENPDTYNIKGKTKVKNNICDFQGTLTITSIEWLKPDENIDPAMKVRQGIIAGKYLFYENKQQSGTGIFSGSFETEFYIDEQQHLQYDALYLISDGYCNNMFSGTWQSYKTGTKKACNWGDFRIPNSNDLDIGAGEFSPDEKYYPFGWQNYKHLYDDSPIGETARQKETYKWWQ